MTQAQAQDKLRLVSDKAERLHKAVRDALNPVVGTDDVQVVADVAALAAEIKEQLGE